MVSRILPSTKVYLIEFAIKIIKIAGNIVTTPSITEEQAIEKLKSENNLIIDEFILSSELVIHKALKGFPCLS